MQPFFFHRPSSELLYCISRVSLFSHVTLTDLHNRSSHPFLIQGPVKYETVIQGTVSLLFCTVQYKHSLQI
jgi:hypothetical protein